MSDQIPDSDNYWVGVNAGGYQNSDYDAACLTARNTRLDDFETYQKAHYDAQQIFMTDLPAIPLYFQLEAAASRIDLCNFTPTVSARSDFWNLETFDIAENCIEPVE
jgi:ABC-type oligopeptide transport system substrate-binding subunit